MPLSPSDRSRSVGTRNDETWTNRSKFLPTSADTPGHDDSAAWINRAGAGLLRSPPQPAAPETDGNASPEDGPLRSSFGGFASGGGGGGGASRTRAHTLSDGLPNEGRSSPSMTMQLAAEAAAAALAPSPPKAAVANLGASPRPITPEKQRKSPAAARAHVVVRAPGTGRTFQTFSARPCGPFFAR